MTAKDPAYTKKVALTARAIEKMKPETFLVDIGENEGLRVNKGKTGLTSFSGGVLKSMLTLNEAIIDVKEG